MSHGTSWRVTEHNAGGGITVGHWDTKGTALKRAYELRSKGARVSVERIIEGIEVPDESYGPDDELPALSKEDL